MSTRPFQLVCGKTWTGCAFGGCKGKTQLPKCVLLLLLLLLLLLMLLLLIMTFCGPRYVEAYMKQQPPYVDEFLTVSIPHTQVMPLPLAAIA